MTTSLESNTQKTAASWTSLPWRTRVSLYLLSKVTDAARRADGTVNRRLMNILDFKSSATPAAPVRGVTSSDVTVDPARKLRFRLFVPQTTSPTPSHLPVVVFFHGGGFIFLSPASFPYDVVCRKFARKIPAVVVSVDYRLCPEHRYPSQYDDGFDVLTFLDQNDDVLPKNADRSRVFFAGDSAGANLAHHVAVRAAREKDRFRVVKPVGLISIQPFFGGEERVESEIRLHGAPLVSVARTDWLWKVFLPDGSDRDHEAVNPSGPNAVDIAGLEYPNTLVFTGGLDPLQDWQRRYYQWLKKSGKEAKLIEYPNMVHAFYVFPELPESNQLVNQVKDFIASV
ncbi:carboxylesterase 18 [Pyrus ussuriensis x Pyrus communis]|uniref:Carboxylesterase 18 n=1 Tax=Pyrus ussuriensis x Pyrus communis TaxID=2448454 RepID=A0A5N5I8N6_9ROSA|nr:probable carboxylesterase 18 [Pyrus x bretschneideri]KAB2635577.1 carboxylesterase 18 [Pyrus ussuriensis x Pyrus communis]